MYPCAGKTDEHILLNHYNMSDSCCKLLSAFIDLNSWPITSARKEHFVIVTHDCVVAYKNYLLSCCDTAPDSSTTDQNW